MYQLRIPYGARDLCADINWGVSLGSIDVADFPALNDIDQAVREAIANPIGMASALLDGFTAGDTVAIIVSDAYRKTGVDRVLPELLNALAGRGIRDVDIRIVFASGIHKIPTPQQQVAILGAAIHDRFRDHIVTASPYDDAQYLAVGQTSRGTPVEINRAVLACDRILATGTVVLHYFGGFGGGRKSIVPGVASARTIAHNHAMNLDPREDRLNPAVRIGTLDGNPVAEDMLEAARLVRVDGIVNTVLNRRGEIAGLFAGEMNAAHRAACAFARDMYAVDIVERADLVIASAGPARNYVQSHKALYNAYQAMKPGGCIIFLAPCEEGLGGEPIEKWLRLGSTAAIIAALRRQSEIYGQTALSTLEKARSAVFVTELPEEDVGLMGGRKAASLEEALALARASLGDGATVLTMPSAAYTVPRYR